MPRSEALRKPQGAQATIVNAVLAALGDWLVALCEYDHASLGYVRYADLPAARYGEKEQAEWRALLQDAEGSLCAADALSVRLYFGTRPELCRMADSLAGVADPTDHEAAAAGLPPIDSLDLWPLLSGANRTSPRRELPIGDTSALLPHGDGRTLVGGLIRWPHKLLVGAADRGHAIDQCVRMGPCLSL